MLIPLDKELENVKAYLSLEQTRFPNKCRIDFQIDPGLHTVIIPPFTLQPLVENAIHYGFPQRKAEGRITIRIYSKNNFLQIAVADNGQGIPKEKVSMLGKQIIDSEKGNGTALYNISQRLKGIYNGRATFKIISQVERGTEIRISIPLDRKGGFYERNAESLYSG